MASTKDLLTALEPFARVWRINEAGIISPAPPALEAPMRDHIPGVWPTMGDCKRANDLLEALGHEFK